MKRNAARWAKRGGIVVLIVAAGVLAVRAWVVPAVLAGQLADRFHGSAKFSDWWLGRSSGVGGLTLREGVKADSPVWLSAEQIKTDISLAGLVRGRFAPSLIEIVGPRLRLRFDRKGNMLTKGPFVGGSSAASTLPDVEIKNAEITIEQEGRPPLVLHGVSGLLDRSEDDEQLKLTSDDSTWGRWSLLARFQPGFKAGDVRLTSGTGFQVNRELAVRVPFIPSEVWSSVTATGPIDVNVTMKITPAESKPLQIQTELALRGAEVSLPGLGIVMQGTTGDVKIEDGLVRLNKLAGKALAGTLETSGTLDFRGASPRFDLALALEKIDVESAPASWQLQEIGATGRLTGKAHLLISLNAGAPDLSGSSGTAEIEREGATFQKIPIKALSVVMHADHDDLKFDTQPSNGVKIATPAEPARFRLPKSITTAIELEDVNLAQLLARLEAITRIKMPVPIAGHLALKANATIPLDRLADLQRYTIRGQATLTAASIDNVDLGRVSSRFDLDKGVLALDDLQGQLVEHGDGTQPLRATPPQPIDAPLLPNSFRGKLRAELSPAGKLTAHFDANALPIGELAAPYLPRPTPIDGRLTTSFDAEAEIAHLDSARAWSAKGRVASRRLSYQGAMLDEVETPFTIEKGRIDLPSLAAKLGGHPLKAQFTIDMEGARDFSGVVDVSDWSIAQVFALIPQAPRPAPATGMIDGHISCSGTMLPRVVRSDGRIVVRAMTVHSIPLGDVNADWVTEGNEIQIKHVHAQPFSGDFTGSATIPIAPGPPITLRADLTKIDTEKVSSLLGKDRFKLEGVASGRFDATIPSDRKNVTAVLTLASPSLKVQGVPTGVVTAKINGKGDVLEYEATADGADGAVRFKGNFPLVGELKDRALNAELQAAGFTLQEIWNLLGLKGAPTHLQGRAAIDANLRARPEADLGLGLNGNVEVRDLRWGHAYPIGNFRGVLAKTPASFRLDSLRGEVLGGAFSGVVWGETPANGQLGVSLELQTDRASLPRIFAFSPSLVKHLDGFGTLRLTGRMDETLRANAEVTVPHARLAGIVLSELRIPAELTVHPGVGNGLIQARRWSAKIAGGRVQGSASMKIGIDRAFNVDMSLTDIDVESIARTESNAARPGSGKVSGRISLHGPDPALPQRFRGKIELSLNDASLAEIPVIRELGRFLGAAQGGAFEQGDLLATVGNRQISIDQFTLQGRVIQIHATGSITFDGGLDIGVLVNTNQVIPQTGQALAGNIPGLGTAIGRSEEALLRVSNFLSNRLLKFRISGTIKSPSVAIDPGVAVGNSATGFFAGALKLPIGAGR